MGGEIYTILLLFVFLLSASAFFSSAEVVYSSERKRLFHILRKNEPAYELLLKPEKFFATILVLNNIANISLTAVITYTSAKMFGPKGVVVSTLLATISIIVFGEIFPKVWAIRNSKDLAKIIVRIISVPAKLMQPIIYPFEKMVKGMAEEELKSYIPFDTLEKEQMNMVKGVAKLAELELKDIMIPKSYVVCLELKMSIGEVVEIIRKTKHTRYPVLHDGKVAGILLSKILMSFLFNEMREGDEKNLTEKKLEDVVKENPNILRPPRLAPPNKSALEQLKDFKKWRTHLVCVINDFGEFEGIVTLEDIIEEIIGDIKDEHSYQSSELFWRKKDVIYARGEAPIRDINREFGLNIDDRFLTIFSTIVSTLGRIPEPGEKIIFDGWEIEVIESSKNRIELVKITRAEESKKMSQKVGETA